MLRDSQLTAFVASDDLARSRHFYEHVLGLRLHSETPIACVFGAGESRLRIVAVREPAIAPYTVLGWAVADLGQAVARLAERGVGCLRYAELEQDDRGLWRAPGGALVAWFNDPDGNVLSLTQPP